MNIIWPDAECCTPDHPDGCVCLPMERALRAWQSGRATAPMSAAQRTACLNEIERVEGYSRAEHEGAPDTDLASTVLSAWLDYARDKGLL